MDGMKTILFVDDDPDMLEIGSIILNRAGYKCVGAADGEIGLELLLSSRPDLIILDYMMPNMNGFEFYKCVVSDPKYAAVKETPVIMLTAISEKEIARHELFEMGLSAFLKKPFGNRELLNVIDNVVILDNMRKKNKELQERVKRTEYKYQDLIENASDLIFTLDTEARFVFINRRLSSITGHERSKWLGKAWTEFLRPQDEEALQNYFAGTIAGRTCTFEAHARHDDGKTIYLSINMNPIFENGQVVGCVGIARNITDKKQLEDEIIELKNFNESIIESMGSGLVTLDLERNITSFNTSAEEVLGFSAKEVINKSFEEVFSKEDCDRLLAHLEEPDTDLLNREMQLETKRGKQVYLGYSVTPRYDTQKRRVGSIISFKDISQIKQMQVEVQRMDRLASMGVLASGIAHEIRNPLAGIKTIAQTLEEEIEPDDAKREYVSRIVRQVNRMDELLKTIFTYAKPRDPKRRFYRLQEVIQEVVALLENRMRSQSVTYAESYHAELPLLYVDFYQIQQVFVNLFLNALDAMPAGGELRLEACPKVTTLHKVDRRGRAFQLQNKSAVYVETKLSDSGEGIPPDTLNSIFNPFFTTKPQGAGLGLSIVYRIVMEHEGDIQVESEIKRGTTFRILLPTEE